MVVERRHARIMRVPLQNTPLVLAVEEPLDQRQTGITTANCVAIFNQDRVQDLDILQPQAKFEAIVGLFFP